MPESEERSLADLPNDRSLAESVVDSVDVSPTVTLENFDLDRWVDGIRPTRRKIKLYPNAHLIGQLEEIANRIDSAPDDADVDDLVEQFDRIRGQFRDGVWFTIEKRSSESVLASRKAIAKRVGIKLDDDGDSTNQADTITLILHQLVEQIVEPTGITYEHLRAMLDANEGEVNKLVLTLDLVQKQLAEKAGVLDRDFSERLSRVRRDS